MTAYPSTQPGHPNEAEIDELARFAYRFSVPTVIRRRDDRGRVDVTGGSGLLMLIADQKRLVTARHVVQQYRDEYIRDAATLFDCMTEIFNPDGRVVGEDATSDLIVLDVEDIEFTPRPDNLPALEFFDPKLPGNDVNVGDRIFFGGWPKAYRDVGFRAMEIFFGYDAVLNVPVTSATEHEFRVKFDRTEWVARLHDDRKPAEYLEDTRLGGHSGAGVFRISPDGARPELVGFIKQDLGGIDGVVCCPITKMRSDGTVKASSLGYIA
jgi:hypothetical protein